jgi:hypothetical protein
MHITADIRTAPHNPTIEGLLSKHAASMRDPDRAAWGERLREWRDALRGGDRRRLDGDRRAFNRELLEFRAGCVGGPGDHGMCAAEGRGAR